MYICEHVLNTGHGLGSERHLHSFQLRDESARHLDRGQRESKIPQMCSVLVSTINTQLKQSQKLALVGLLQHHLHQTLGPVDRLVGLHLLAANTHEGQMRVGCSATWVRGAFASSVLLLWLFFLPLPLPLPFLFPLLSCDSSKALFIAA